MLKPIDLLLLGRSGVQVEVDLADVAALFVKLGLGVGVDLVVEVLLSHNFN